MSREIGQRVRIRDTYGVPEFRGLVGTIKSVEWRATRDELYLVRLDNKKKFLTRNHHDWSFMHSDIEDHFELTMENLVQEYEV